MLGAMSHVGAHMQIYESLRQSENTIYIYLYWPLRCSQNREHTAQHTCQSPRPSKIYHTNKYLHIIIYDMENDQFCALTRIIGNIKFNNTSYE